MAIKSDSYLASLFGLEGKTIVVTGAGGGIGLAISEGLLRAGAEVALCNRTTAKCKPLADRIIAEGGTASLHKLDVTSLDSIHACVDEVIAQYGKIDVLFNVAGINKREGLLDVEEADYDRIMDTNLKGLFGRCTSAAPAASSISAPTTTRGCWADALSTAPPRAAW